MKKAIIVLAEGFEEVEAFAPIDILRRCQVDVVVAALTKDEVASAHNVTVKPDVLIDEVTELPDVLIFPGGMPGAENLALSKKVKDLVLKMAAEGKLIAAICASPALVLAPLGVLEGKTATCYPGMESNFPAGTKHSTNNVVQDGNLITSLGPATAFEFGLKIAENLVGKQKTDMIASQMLFEG